MSSFDFNHYLQQHLRDHTAQGGQIFVQPITGGLTNYTTRATFSTPLSAIQTLDGALSVPNLASVILKQAPPHIAWDATRPMSVDRQLVEKKAFEVLAGADADFPALAPQLARACEGRVRVPRLFWHDDAAHVLWIEDLGAQPTLSAALLVPGAHVVAEERTLAAVAHDLGAFLAALFAATARPPASFAAYIARVSDRSGIYDYLADVVRGFLAGAGMADAGELAERVRTGFDAAEDEEPPKCLGMVDFWPENVLVELEAEPAGCGLVDWEYFGVSDAASELGMFLAHLHVHMLNASTSAIAKQRIKDFTRAWLTAYVEGQETWKPSNGFIRRLLLSHGRDLVRGVKLYSEKLDEASKLRLFEAGARSLRAAGDSTDKIDVSFLQPVGDEGDLSDIWEASSILVSV